MVDKLTPALVRHTLDPVVDEQSRVLLLGSMPSPLSREVGFYYGNPQNRFWRVLAAVFDEPVPGLLANGTLDPNVAALNAARTELCLRNHVALWDVLQSCRIAGASDASIRDAMPNDIAGLLATTNVSAVFCTGGTAATYYKRLVEPTGCPACVKLPSTSPANAAWSLDALIEAYKPVSLAAQS